MFFCKWYTGSGTKLLGQVALFTKETGIENGRKTVLKNTDRFEFEQIINEFSDMVYRIARIYGWTKEDAEDIFQEVFLRLVRNIDGLESKEHIRNWLIRVTINCGKTYRMKMARNPMLPFDEGLVTENSGEQSDLEWKVYTAVRSLPPKYRAIIHLYYYEELSIKEISKCLDRREGTVKSQLARGRALLEKKLGKEFGDGTAL